jgi:hypothetical protein
MASVALCVGLAVQAGAALFDHSSYDAILQHYVDADGYVDYAGVRDNAHSALDSYIIGLGDADLAGWSQNERLAFWINAYNARVLQLVITQSPKKKFSEDLAFDEPFKVAGSRLSPNDILFRIIRGRQNPENKGGPIDGLTMAKPDPRALFALVPGAVGGPRLRNAAYTPDNVDRFLRENVSVFMNDPRKVDVRDGALHLSRIFKWCKRDFQAAGGVPEFIGDLLKPDLRLDAESLQMQLKTLYPKAVYDYDWRLNDVKNKETTGPTHSEAAPEPAGPSAEEAPAPDAAPAPTTPDGTETPSAPVHPTYKDLGK